MTPAQCAADPAGFLPVLLRKEEVRKEIVIGVNEGPVTASKLVVIIGRSEVAAYGASGELQDGGAHRWTEMPRCIATGPTPGHVGAVVVDRLLGNVDFGVLRLDIVIGAKSHVE